jgi:formylglycine-generating enzyme required for sulfatase activity
MARKQDMDTSLRCWVFVAFFWLFAPYASTAQQPLSDIEGATPGTVFRDCAACPEMVVIPLGTITIGSPDSEHGRDPDEQPQRRVTIPSAFAVARFELTRGQFSAFISDSGYASEGGGNCWYWNEQERNAKNDDPRRNWRDVGFAQENNHPVVCVSWRDAKAYTAWLSSRTGRQYRLLTEAEWEYGARAGSATPRFWGADPNDACYYANVGDLAFTRSLLSRQSGPKVSAIAYHQCDDGYAYTAPVGRFRSNGFGLYDMMGNVLEWVEDCWNDSYDDAPSGGSAWLTGDCRRRVARGGGWSDIPNFVRSANRDGKAAGLRMLNLGFRVARPN